MSSSEGDSRPPRNDFIHGTALAGAVLSPLAMLLPPRKADIRALVLLATFSLSANQLAWDYTGESVYARLGNRVGSVFDTSLPEGARRTQQVLREQREREAASRNKSGDGKEGDKKGGVLRDIWMGGEDENWRQRRAEEHRRSFEEGKGMSDIIFEQISDVWSGRWREKPDKEDQERQKEDEKDKGEEDQSERKS